MMIIYGVSEGMIILQRKNRFKAAVVQAGSEVMDIEKGVRKTVHLIAEASRENAKIIVFPEAFLPAYPRGMSFGTVVGSRSEEHTSELQSRFDLVCRLLLEKKNAISV